MPNQTHIRVLLLLSAILAVNGLVAQPTISRFTPSSGQQGQLVRIQGTNLGNVLQVRFGSLNASFYRVNNNLLYAVAPQNVANGIIEVRSAAGSDQSGSLFSIVSAWDSQCLQGLSPLCESPMIAQIRIPTTRFRYDTIGTRLLQCAGGGAGGVIPEITLPTLTDWTDTLRGGNTYNLQVTTLRPSRVICWVDWNKNGRYESNEYYDGGIQTAPGTSSMSFTVPDTAFGGLTRVRVKTLPASQTFDAATYGCQSTSNTQSVDFSLFMIGSGNVAGYCGPRQATAACDPANRLTSLAITNGKGLTTSLISCPTNGFNGYTLIPHTGPNAVTTTLHAGAEYNMRLGVTTATMRAAGYIDFNRDGVFDTDEIVFGTTFFPNSRVATQKFVVPRDVPSGLTRMRIRVGAAGAMPPACGFGTSQTLDYTILLDSIPNAYCQGTLQTNTCNGASRILSISAENSGLNLVMPACPVGSSAYYDLFGSPVPSHLLDITELTHRLTVTANQSGTVLVWVDYNLNEHFDEIEGYGINVVANVPANINLSRIANALNGTGIARIRFLPGQTFNTSLLSTACTPRTSGQTIDLPIRIRQISTAPTACYTAQHNGVCGSTGIISQATISTTPFDYTESNCLGDRVDLRNFDVPENNATFFVGNTYSFTLESNSTRLQMEAWIDLNGDGFFAASECVRLSRFNNISFRGSITIPQSATSGHVTMRLRGVNSPDVMTPSDACIFYAEGVTRDFLVRLQGTCLSQPIITNSISTNNQVGICSGGSVELRGPLGYQYLWSNNATTQNITVNTAGNYSLRLIAGTCTSAASAAIQVSLVATPTAATIINNSGSNVICGGPIMLSTNYTAANARYRWSNGDTTATISVSQPGTYTVAVGQGSCFSPQSVGYPVVSGVASPIPTIASPGSTTVCLGQSLILSGPAGAAQYLWSNGATSQQIQVTAGGTFSLQVRNPNACLSAPSQPITVSVLPKPLPVPVTAATSPSICPGDSVNLSAPAGYAQYLWSNGQTRRTIRVGSAGNYTVRVASVVGGCFSDTLAGFSASGITAYPVGATATDSITLFLNPNLTCPLASQNASTSMVGASVVRLHAGVTIGGTPFSRLVNTTTVAVEPQTRFSGNATSGWYKKILPTAYFGIPNTEVATALDFVLNGDAASGGWFVKEGKVAAICSDFKVNFPITASAVASPFGVTVRVLSAPSPVTPSVTGSRQACNGDSILISAPTGFSAYRWSNGATTRTIYAKTSGRYNVRVSNGACFSDTGIGANSVAITILPAVATPTISATIDSVCPGGQSVISVINPQPGLQYLWSNNQVGTQITTNGPGSYRVRTISGTCTSSFSAILIVRLLATPPAPLLTPFGKTFLCNTGSDSVVLIANVASGTVRWNNGFIGNRLTVRIGGQYSAINIGASGCPSPSSSTFTIVTYNQPIAGLTQRNDTLFASGGQSYHWLLNGSRISPLAGNFLVPSASGRYQVVAINGLCTDTSSILTQIESGPISKPTLKIYPNPTSGQLQIDLSDFGGNNNLSGRLTTLTGQVVWQGILEVGATNKIDFTSMPAGLYLFDLWDGNKHVIQKIRKD